MRAQCKDSPWRPFGPANLGLCAPFPISVGYEIHGVIGQFRRGGITMRRPRRDVDSPWGELQVAQHEFLPPNLPTKWGLHTDPPRSASGRSMTAQQPVAWACGCKKHGRQRMRTPCDGSPELSCTSPPLGALPTKNPFSTTYSTCIGKVTSPMWRTLRGEISAQLLKPSSMPMPTNEPWANGHLRALYVKAYLALRAYHALLTLQL